MTLYRRVRVGVASIDVAQCASISEIARPLLALPAGLAASLRAWVLAGWREGASVPDAPARPAPHLANLVISFADGPWQ
jgi:hypothetical protein